MSPSDAAGPSARRPLLTLDFDGVICRPPFGLNVGIHRAFLDPAATPIPARVYPRWLNAALDHLRFDLRASMPGVREALAALRTVRRLVIVTGRRTPPTAWLRRHHLDGLVEEVVVNDTALKSPHFKREALRALAADEHVDDDPRTAQLLAQASSTRVFLCDWPRNRGLAYDARIERVRDLRDLARRLTDPRGAPEA
ncbi:MAG: hypothetical protein EXR64_00105 [Dehalococcoidia bacterium]|nr:hypothetical protein [Dehalococcoidia bacterium]